jgi:hypothetical protein
VRYEAVNAMLLNEFLEVTWQNGRARSGDCEATKEIEALTAGLQKVSTGLQLSRQAPETAFNDQ